MIEGSARGVGARGLSDEGRDRAEGESRSDRLRITDAVRHLEERLAAAAPGRQREWMRDVRGSLDRLREAMRGHAELAETSDGLLADIELTAPHLFPTVERLAAEFEGLRHRTDDLARELGRYVEAEVPDFAHARQSLALLLLGLRDHLARETDLIFEVYHRDIGTCD